MQNPIPDCSGIVEDETLIESEDTSCPLLRQCGEAAPSGTPVAIEQQRVLAEALSLLQDQLGVLQGQNKPSKSATSELLRDTCQDISNLVMNLEQTWQKTHPGEPQPRWPLEVIPQEELALIGWDFHANRVQMQNEGASFWSTLSYLIKADQSNFAQPPSAQQVEQALGRTKDRLYKMQAANHAASPNKETERLFKMQY
jgi:hypothetical protein